MEKVVIIDGVRTPMGRSKGGAFRHVKAENLSAQLMQALLKRNPDIDPNDIGDVIWGCVQQTLEQGFNIARNAALLAELPHKVPAVTVNRLCGSSMQALHDGARQIMLGESQVALIGGVEHMGHVPMTYNADFNPALNLSVAKASFSMGLTAEMLAKSFQISREEQDKFAYRSHHLAALATQKGYFDNELVAINGHDAAGDFIRVSTDEVIRYNPSLDELAQLRPVFDPATGSVTAGNSSAVSDGASAMFITSESYAKQHHLKPRAIIRSMAVTGCDPAIMGYGPVPATEIALKKAGLTLSDIDIFELNEAFAAQSLACMKKMNLLDSIDDKINLNGGAIALGHPLGCSGARITTTLLNIMERKDAQLGLATMCIGLGQGIATIIERV
ncbi:TPA: acetyl-CoA C-acyltransferase FadA [Proteus mirabilis]|nr:acetyl-CoA C-acyltransferase FadA [Proteus mirabilis]